MKRILPFIIIFIVAVFYTKPFFQSGFFSTHDGQWAVVRMADMFRELKDLQIPPRWSGYLNHGFGYPLFNFAYPMPYYLGMIFKVLGFGFIDSVKAVFVLSVILSGVFMFLLGRELSSEFGGLISSLMYLVAPFRLVDLYVRGSIGESLSLAVFPLLFYTTVKYIQKPTFLKLNFTGIILAVLIMTHNIMALVFFPFWIFFFYTMVVSYYQDIKTYTWKFLLPAVLIGFGLSAFFFIPALIEKKYIVLSQIQLADKSSNFIKLPDYLLSAWSYEKPSFQLGWAHILAAISGMIAVFASTKLIKKKHLPMAVYIVLSIFVLVFLAHPFSQVFWKIAPLSYIDFPWRLLTPLAFFLALASMYLSLKKATKIIAVIFVFIVLVLSFQFAKPSEYIEKDDLFYLTNDATTTSKDEFMPLWVKEKPTDRFNKKVEVEQGTAVVTDIDYNSHKISFRAVSQDSSVIKINMIYFPGWRIFVDNREIVPDYTHPQGVMRIGLQTGDFQVFANLDKTPVRQWSDVISFIGWLTVISSTIFLLIKSPRKVKT